MQLLTNGAWREHAAAERGAREAIEELQKALATAQAIATTTMRDVQGTPTIGGSAVRHLCAWQAPLSLLLESAHLALAGPEGYLTSELHNFIACTFTRPDYAAALGCNGKPDINDLAAIWLLSGKDVKVRPDTWTKKPDGITAIDYRSKVRDAVRDAIKPYRGAPPELP